MSNSNFKKQEDAARFHRVQLELVARAAQAAEEMVNNYYKLSSSDWLKNRYDIQTAKDLSGAERLDGPLAQVIKYQGRKAGKALGSSLFSFYKICLQDRTILSAAGAHQFDLYALLLYVLTHELVHVVRFSTFEHRYENQSEVDVTCAEERRVHGITRDILKDVSISGLNQVVEFYDDWLFGDPDFLSLKNLSRHS
mgnify:CR=1 FL=1